MVSPTYFRVYEFNTHQGRLLKILVEKYFEAGFSDLDTQPALVGHRAYLVLVSKYPSSFSEYTRAASESDFCQPAEERWLNATPLPVLRRAYLSIYQDGRVELLHPQST